MSSRPPTLAQFLDAKTNFLAVAREAKATIDGMINGHELEEELVSKPTLMYFKLNFFTS